MEWICEFFVLCLRSFNMRCRTLDDWCPTFRDTGHSTLEDENMLSRNVGHQSSTDAAPYPRRTETSTAPLRKPWRLAIYFVERCIPRWVEIWIV